MIDLSRPPVPLLGFAAFSGTGKTTLLTALIPRLKAVGLRVGVIKHSHHRFDIDTPGKDSFQLRAAGASPVMLSSSHRRAIMMELAPAEEPDLALELEFFPWRGLDLILVEGFRQAAFDKIELHRPCLGFPLLFPDDAHVIAIATDAALPLVPPIRQLDLNRPDLIAAFILDDYLSGHDH